MAPYEVMRQSSASAGPASGSAAGSAARSASKRPTHGTASQGASGGEDAVEAGLGPGPGLDDAVDASGVASPRGGRHPLLLRVPKGYIAVAGAVLVAVIVLAYWSGRSIGYRAGFRAANEQFEALRPGVMWDGFATDGSGVGGSASGGAAGGARGAGEADGVAAGPVARVVRGPTSGARAEAGARTGGEADPRQVGLNYWVLAHYRQAEAQRLLKFLWSQGVDAAAFGRHNDGLFQVQALRGFAAGELDGPAEAYRRQLLTLGRVWKDKHRGSDLARNGIYLDKFEGESVAIMIVRGR